MRDGVRLGLFEEVGCVVDVGIVGFFERRFEDEFYGCRFDSFRLSGLFRLYFV